MNIKDFINDNEELNIKKVDSKRDGYIYFICNKQGSIMYIGTTCNLGSRIATHKQSVQFAGKNFYYFSYPNRLCLQKEAELIKEFRPRHNRAHNGLYNISRKYHPLKAIVKDMGRTQVSIAKELGVTRQAVSLILNGQTTTGEIFKKVEELVNSW